VPVESFRQLPRLHIPQADHFLFARRGQQRSIGRKSHAGDRSSVIAQRLQRPGGFHVKQLDAMLGIARRQQ
jgi:hypothetical protein